MRTTQKVSQRQITTIRYWVAGGVAALLIFFGFFLYYNFGTSTKAYAATTYYTRKAGEWGKPATWSTSSTSGGSCGCTPGCNIKDVMYIEYNLFDSTCNPLQVTAGGDLRVQNGGNLTLVNGLQMGGHGSITINSGDSMKVYGNVSMSGTSSIVNNGYLVIYGSVSTGGSSSICGSGSGYVVNGTISGSGWCFGAALPVSLISFNVTVKDQNKVLIKWATVSEKNNDYFTIERSNNSNNFEMVTNVKGAGNSNVQRNYSFTDEHPIEGVSYYRLKQTDFDGKQTIFDVKYINLKEAGDSRFIIYPNPVKAGANIYARLSTDIERAVFSLYNTNGVLIYEQNLEGISANTPYEINAGNDLHANTIYVYSVTVNQTKLCSGKLRVD